MAACRDCGAKIIFAFNETRERWLPIEYRTHRSSDSPFEGGVYLEQHHEVHRCAKRQQVSGAKGSPHHAALHLLPSAPIQVVKAAYRALALIHHPDKGGSNDRMRELNAALEAIEREQR